MRPARRLIIRSEEKLRARLKELPDGQWQSRQYLSVEDEVCRVELTMTKRDDSLTFDFSGSSEQSRYAINCTKWASLGGLFAPLFPLLCYDITWNEGVISPITMIAPRGHHRELHPPGPGLRGDRRGHTVRQQRRLHHHRQDAQRL